MSTPPNSAADNATAAYLQLTRDLTLPAAVRDAGMAVGAILLELRLDPVIAQAGMAMPLLAANRLDTGTLAQRIGVEAAELAAEVLALPALESFASGDLATTSPSQADKLRKLILAVIRDARVLVIKLVMRLQELRSARDADAARQQALALTTREIYAPLANRLGIWQLKWELEDCAFRYLEPEHYRTIAAQLRERRSQRETFIAEVIASLGRALAAAGIHAEVAGRPKHIYSIWRKMQRKHLAFDQLYDLNAVRVLVNSVTECYAALGVAHGLWRHIPREFDDYIATPKDNLYRSLHTAVLGPGGRAVEIQIRTHEMHQQAELGVAAHWRYKEGMRFDAGLEARLGWMRQLLAPGSDADFIDRLHAELVEERVYVLTPKGEVLDLPRGATPLDFAYHVHTSIGHRCRGARVNGRLVPLSQALESGDQVEVVTARDGEPSRDWLNPAAGFLATARARDKVRAFFRAQDRERNLHAGRELLERELERLGLRGFRHDRLLKQLEFGAMDEVFAALGAGDLTAAQLAGALQRELAAERGNAALTPAPRPTGAQPLKASGVRVAGMGNLLTSLARCCHPLPGEAIRGYTTRGRGISVHRADCASLKRLLARTPEREVAVAWPPGERHYPVDLSLEAEAGRRLLPEITAVLSDEKIPLLAMQSGADPGRVSLKLRVALTDLPSLSRLLARLAQVPGVLRVGRENR